MRIERLRVAAWVLLMVVHVHNIAYGGALSSSSADAPATTFLVASNKIHETEISRGKQLFDFEIAW